MRLWYGYTLEAENKPPESHDIWLDTERIKPWRDFQGRRPEDNPRLYELIFCDWVEENLDELFPDSGDMARIGYEGDGVDVVVDDDVSLEICGEIAYRVTDINILDWELSEDDDIEAFTFEEEPLWELEDYGLKRGYGLV